MITLDQLFIRKVELHKKHGQMVIDLNDPHDLQTLRMHMSDAHDLGVGRAVEMMQKAEKELSDERS